MNNLLKILTDSRFAMWRAVIAVMHLDKIVMPHEVNYALKCLKNVPLSDEQRQILLDDMVSPVALEDVFNEITHPQDCADFFRYARELSWADGEMTAVEEQMISKLMERVGAIDTERNNYHVVIAEAVRKIKERRSESGALFTGKSAYR
jgi:hypothetical protein